MLGATLVGSEGLEIYFNSICLDVINLSLLTCYYLPFLLDMKEKTKKP